MPSRQPARPLFPAQRALMLPLLETLADAGGAARPAEVVEALASRVGLSAEARAATTAAGTAGAINAWARHVRWVRQQAVAQGFVSGAQRNLWVLSETGREGLQHIRPGIVVTVYETPLGEALWAECESAAALTAAGSVHLILTSPPYPLLRPKAYGNRAEAAHVDWLLRCAADWHHVLADDGSLVLNVADTWERGRPTQALWQERLLLRLVDELGFYLAQRCYWENSAKLPAPAEWVNVRRVRVTPSVEQIYWLAKTPHPKADNRRVLRPYSASMRARLAAGGEQPRRRPSGHAFAAGAFAVDRGGSIPHALLTLPNTASNDAYQRACRAQGLPPHPARFPAGLPEFFVRLCTEPGGLVYDPFGGSGQTAAVCEALGRRWRTSEKSLVYVRGSLTRFAELPGLRRSPILDALEAAA